MPSSMRNFGDPGLGGMKTAQRQRMDPTYAVNKNARILIVDDDEASASALARLIKKAGYAICITITNPVLVVERFIHINPDIVLLDLHMEPLSGIEVLQRLGAIMAPRARPPVLVLTADTTLDAKREALAAGATDFLSKPLDHIEVLLRIRHLLETRSLFLQCRHYSEKLERLVSERTAELQKQTGDLEQAVAELKETQYQVIQQERLQALGTMASGIAHDLNNGLSLILGYGDMLLTNAEKFPPESKERTCLETIVCAGRDTAQMVRRLREFHRPSAEREDRQVVSLNDVVEEAITLTAPRWQAKAEADGVTIHITKDLRPTPPISGSPSELREVLTNLIFNAVDAMPRGGKLSFRTRQMGKRVRLEIADTGTGMSNETIRHCLEPFYTTKGAGGSGLGLAMSYGIIQRHGGTINIDSRLKEGTLFTIYLPASERPIEPAISPNLKKEVCPLRVLVVDDHPGILEIVSAYLVEDRHRVETAAGAQEAMIKFCGGRFDLVIMDQAMPEANGNELAAMIKRTDPSEPIIMLTGFADLMNEGGERSKNVDLVLRKPVRLEDLRQAIVNVMPAN
jgi:signal transduction histidine kinase